MLLQRKREALLLLAKDLEKCMGERDHLRALVKKFVGACQCAAATLLEHETKATTSTSGGGADANREREFELRRQKSMVDELIKQKNGLQGEVRELETKLSEAQEDIKLLRQTVARQRVGSTGNSSVGAKCSVDSESETLENLISQLESVKQRNEELEQEMFNFREQSKEQSTEKEFFVSRSERLNTELNYLLSGDSDKAIIDIDALALENNHLKTQIAQLQCEKNILKDHYLKLKQSLTKPKYPKKTDKNLFRDVSQKTETVVDGGEITTQKILSTKEVQQYLTGPSSKHFPVNARTIEQLHTLALSLTETIEERNVALSHQKSTNKALGHRVSELESKLRTIESSGLWCAARVRQDRILCIQEELTDILSCEKESDEETEREAKTLFKHYSSEESKTSNTTCSHRCAIHTASGTAKVAQSRSESLRIFTEDLDPLAQEKAVEMSRSAHGKEVLEKFLSSIDSHLSQELDENVLDDPVEQSKTNVNSVKSENLGQHGTQSGSQDDGKDPLVGREPFEEVHF